MYTALAVRVAVGDPVSDAERVPDDETEVLRDGDPERLREPVPVPVADRERLRGWVRVSVGVPVSVSGADADGLRVLDAEGRVGVLVGVTECVALCTIDRVHVGDLEREPEAESLPETEGEAVRE